MPTILIDFWKVEPSPRCSHSFEEMLVAANSLPADECRAMTHGRHNIRLQELHKTNDMWHGDMILIRSDPVPVRAKLDGSVNPIALDDDEGLGNETAFLFDTLNQVLVTQRNAEAVLASVIPKYLKDKTKAVGENKIVPLISFDALQKLERMQVI